MRLRLASCLAAAALLGCAAAAAQSTSTPAASSLTPAEQDAIARLQAAASSPAPAPSPAPAIPPTTTPVEQAPPVPQSTTTETTLAGTRVFGGWLFQGKFAQESFRGFNPDYVIAVGDVIDLKLWGAYTLNAQVPVDAQGNIFVPQVGPVHVANTRNAELNDVVQGKVKTVYRENVGVYASLAAAQPVKVFVGGYVRRPGLYAAAASDSLLHFIDAAGGIDPDAGSFLDVRVMRGGEMLRRINLYDFLLRGALPLVQLHDGDTLFVGPIRSTVLVTGLVATPVQFEFDDSMSVAQLLQMAGVNARATNVRVTRNQGSRRTVDYLAIDADLDKVPVQAGDEIEVMADRLVGNIIVSVEGEHEGSGQYVLPYKSTLKDLLERVKFSDASQRDSIQLFRKSLVERQKQMLEDTLHRLEMAALSGRSGTQQEAQLRTQEASLILQFIERARKVEPRGQVVLPHDVDATQIALEDGDVLRIPRQTNLVAVHGEVYFPNAFVWRKGLDVENYVADAGGMTQSADDDRILILRVNGEVDVTRWHGFFDFPAVQPGDEILVLPQVDRKSFQLTKDIVEVIYQIAVAAGVVLRL